MSARVCVCVSGKRKNEKGSVCPEATNDLRLCCWTNARARRGFFF